MTNTSSDIQVGSQFGSFSALEQEIKNYQKRHFVQFSTRDSRTIKAAKQRAPNRTFNHSLVYSEITYCCVEGGKKYKSESKGERPNQLTIKKDCPAEIKIRASQDGRHLVVTSINSNHNHKLSKVLFGHYPQQRRLDVTLQDEATTMVVELKADKKLVQQHMSAKSGNVVILKDIHNLATRAQAATDKSKALEDAIQELKKSPGAIVEVTVNDDNVLSGIYFQDAYMVENYKRFPEMLFIDATHKLNELRMPLYVLLVEDGNGESQIVSLWLVANEDAVTITAMALIFKNHNKDWVRTLTIMSDKDFTERNVLLQEFPGAKLLICLYHVLRTFRREITSNKMGITAAERSHVLDILQRMSYATNEEAYFSAYEELKQTKLKIVLDYFNDNWHEIRDEWVCGLKDENLMFQNHTNNRVESINQKLKSVMSKFARLPQFCRELLKVLSSLHVERDHRAITLFQKTPSQPFPKGSVKSQYMQVVTPFALSYIVKQIDLVSKVKLKPEEGDTYECESSSKIHISASSEDCNCSFRKAMQLPCKHILAVCQKSNLPLFQPALCAERWTLEYYRSSQLILQDQNEHYVFTDGDSIPVSMVTQPKRAVLS